MNTIKQVKDMDSTVVTMTGGIQVQICEVCEISRKSGVKAKVASKFLDGYVVMMCAMVTMVALMPVTLMSMHY
jgi:hypothetical protein